MAILQRTLAKRLKVSQMTVSRALRGESGISEETRSRILEAARLSGIALPPSRKLAAGKDLLHAVCTLTPDRDGKNADSPFHARLRDGLQRGARECASEVINCQEPTGAWPLVVVRNQVDGVVIVGGAEHALLPEAPCPMPRVYIFRGPPSADVLSVDNFGGGLQLGAHLAAKGHRRVAFIGPETRIARERLSGLRSGLELAGITCPVTLAQLKIRSGGQSPAHIDDLLAGETSPHVLRQRFTAIAAYNDWFAIHAIRRLKELGLRVPEDISVTGFDNAIPSWYDGPKLTTCAIPVEELGAEAVRLVYWRIEHPNAVRRTLTLETEWVEGDSVATVPKD
jgi:LacI family transcriptional regulator